MSGPFSCLADLQEDDHDGLNINPGDVDESKKRHNRSVTLRERDLSVRRGLRSEPFVSYLAHSKTKPSLAY